MPVLVAAAPLVLLSALTIADIWHHVAGAIALGGLTFAALAAANVLGQAIGDKGATVEQRLSKEWDESPADHPLRHRDALFNNIHAQSGPAAPDRRGSGLSFPPEAGQRHNQVAADALSARGPMSVGPRSRDSGRYKLVRKAKAAYEFQRNALGLRSIGLALNLTCAAGSAVATVISWPLSKPEWLFPAVGLLSILCAVWWRTRGFDSVRRAANAYAQRLAERREEM